MQRQVVRGDTMRKIAWTMAAILAVGLAGCGLIVIEDRWERELLDDTIRDAAAELNLHYAVVDGAATVQRAMDDVGRRLRGRILVMVCDGSGHASMMGFMVAWEDRVSAYLVAAAAAPTLAEARTICRDYADDMDELMDRMRDRAGAMDCREG
jgi:hypothetical protein